MPTTKANVTPIRPLVEPTDMQRLEGGLFTVDGRFTLKGKLLVQPIKDAAFAAYAYKASDDAAPAKTHREIDDLLASCSPFKDGVDASPVDPIVLSELAGKKPRADMIFDILVQPDMTDEQVASLKEGIKVLKAQAVDEQIHYLVKRNMGGGTGGSKGVHDRIAIGAAQLTEMDASWDSAFLTNGAKFLINDNTFTFSDFDKANLNYMRGILGGVEGGVEKKVPKAIAL